MTLLKIFTVLVLWLHICNAQQTYKAAVYERYPERPSLSLSGRDSILKNLDIYETTCENARQQSVNIIVFPEYGLTSRAANPEESSVEIRQNQQPFHDEILTRLSNMAKGHGMYVVVNLLEKQVESSPSTTEYFNTNLVFDKQGAIIAKYRKINLYNEPKLSAGNESVTFSTDFGVTFGLFTGYDILFAHPSRTVLESGAVADVAYPAAWPNTLPFAPALPTQYGYARSTGANLLAANYNNETESLGGSGIYHANGTIAETFISAQAGVSKLIFKSLPVTTSRQEPAKCLQIVPFEKPPTIGRGLGGQGPDMSYFHSGRIFEAGKYTFQDVQLGETSKKTTKVCHNNVCCNFIYSVRQSNQNDHYKLMAFGGSLQLLPGNTAPKPVQICTILACTSSSIESCGQIVNSTTQFADLSIEAEFPVTDKDTFYQPIAVDTKLEPIEQTEFCVTKDNKTAKVIIRAYPAENFVTIGVLARGSNSASAIGHGLALFVLAAAALLRLL